MERVFALLQKTSSTASPGPPEKLRIAVATWTEKIYHRRRRQAALGRLTLVDYELIVLPTDTQAA